MSPIAPFFPKPRLQQGERALRRLQPLAWGSMRDRANTRVKPPCDHMEVSSMQTRRQPPLHSHMRQRQRHLRQVRLAMWC